MTGSFAAVSQLVDALGHVPVVVGVLTKGSLLIVLAVALTRALGRAPAAARHIVWSLSVAALLLLPATSWLPWRLELPMLGTARDALGVSVTPPAVNTTRSSIEAGNDAVAAPDAAALRADTPPEIDASTPSRTTPPTQATPRFVATIIDRLGTPAAILITLWLAGSLWMLARLAIGVAGVRSMIRRSEPATGDEWDEILERAQKSIGGRAIARTVISDHAAMPFTYGLFRPTIVLPASAEEWTTDRRRSVLLHELAHVRRHDLITNAVVQLACAVYWFHPLVWLAARRVRIEAERACDALVVGTGTLPSEYAGDLLEIARTMRSSATAAVALAMARRSDFEGRLLAILAPNSGRNVLTAARAVLVALSFAAPAAAVAAAVPPGAATPNAIISEATSTESEESNTVASQKHPNLAEHVPESPKVEAPSAAQAPSPAATQSRDAAVPGLISVLKDESAAVRLASVQALEQLQDPRAIDALIDVMKGDADARVREAAASALGSIDSQRAVPGLIAALGSERVTAVRAKIAWALGEIEDPRAVDALSAALKDQAAEVRHQAVWALGEIGSAEAVPALIPMLRDSDAELRKQVAEALGEIENVDAIPALSTATKDSDAGVREQAVQALGQIENVKALPALVAALNDDVVEVRRSAVEAIGDIDELHTAPPGLIAALKDADAEVRQNAAQALGNIEDKAAVPGLIPLTRDANPDVKRSAVEALSNIGGEAAIEAIVVLLKDSDPEIRKIAAEALGKNR